jgi:hypothetical protein
MNLFSRCCSPTRKGLEARPAWEQKESQRRQARSRVSWDSSCFESRIIQLFAESLNEKGGEMLKALGINCGKCVWKHWVSA